MEITVTVVDPAAAGAPVDVVVRAEPGTPFVNVQEQLARTAGRRAGRFFCSGEPVPDDHPLGCFPLLDGAVLTLDRPAPEDPPGMLEVHVRSGPDAGGVYRLRPGEHGIGRGVHARIRVDDPDVSRLHALLRTGPDRSGRTTVHDLGSTNGTTVDGEPVPRAGRELRPGQLLATGATRLELVVPELTPVSCRPDGAGHVLVNRPPRHLTSGSSQRIDLPSAPAPREPPRLPVAAIALPVVAGLVLVAVTGSPTYLLFVLLSPLMMVGSHLGERSTGRRTERRLQAEHADAAAAAESRISAAVAADGAARLRRHPGLDELILDATGPRPRLWERRRDDPDFLQVRLGLGTGDAAVEIHVPARGGVPASVRRPQVREVPVTVDLRAAGVLGIAGPRPVVSAVARAVVAQLAGWHSPRHLALVLLCDGDGNDWEWARWLPHIRPAEAARNGARALVATDPRQVRRRVDELVAAVESRLTGTERHPLRPWAGPVTVVVLDGAASLRRLPGVARVLSDGPHVGIHLICTDEAVVALPAECGATAEVTGDVGTRLRVVTEDATTYDDVALDGLGLRWAHRFARALAPLRDATPDAVGDALPDHVRLVDLLGRHHDVTDPAALAHLWTAHPRSTKAVLGVGGEGQPLVVDLAVDGPHVLVAGTTGAGKSELLQTLVATLALANGPDEMTFVLVDYKGGAAFGDCARLPHTVGFVTDLDGHLTERALVSLAAELRRRERLLRDAGCGDIGGYPAARAASAVPMPSLPRLVLVVDEFATLADELPDFVGGLVGIAQRGRSLGVHLVLATQRPGGVVSADIRANTGLRIALRVTDPGESVDVVDVRDAADISPATPGRAVLRTGSGQVRHLQTARVGGRAEISADPRVQALPWPQLGDPPPPDRGRPIEGPSDLTTLVDSACQAARSLGVATGRSPWLAPLPTVLPIGRLDPSGTERRSGAVAIGLADLPRKQRQEEFLLRLVGGDHLLVVGGPRSGRTTLLRTAATRLAEAHPVDDVHLYAYDAGGGLAALAGLPHCGAVIGRDETDRGVRLMARLASEVHRRQRLLAREGLGSVDEQRGRSSYDGAGEALAWMVLLVDGLEALQQVYDDVDRGQWLESLHLLVREGAAAGVRVLLTGDRGTLTGRLGSGFTQRIVLPLADPADYSLAGIAPRQVPRLRPPGRGLMAPDATEVQIGVLGTDPGTAAQLAAVQEAARQLAAVQKVPPGPGQGPLHVEQLPDRVELAEVERDAKEVSTGPDWVLAGVGGDECRPLGFDLDLDGPAFVVAGPPRSGRSTALASMGHWLLGQGRQVAVVSHRRSPLRQLDGAPGVLGCFGSAEGAAVTDLLAGHPDAVVLADDAETLHDTPVERPLLDLLRLDREGHGALVVAGAAADLALAFRGLTVEARRGRTGLLLGPATPAESELLGLRSTRLQPGPPGRGLLVVRGRPTPVQVVVAGADRQRRLDRQRPTMGG